MRKLQAAMRDKSAKGWREARLYYRVGSVFKGCSNCGELDPYKDRPVFVSGTSVMRAYSPKWVGWTYKCFDCQATDHACWANAFDVGEEPRLLPREELARYRKEAIERWKLDNGVSEEETPARSRSGGSSRDAQIAELEAQLAKLREMLKY